MNLDANTLLLGLIFAVVIIAALYYTRSIKTRIGKDGFELSADKNRVKSKIVQVESIHGDCEVKVKSQDDQHVSVKDVSNGSNIDIR